MTLTIVKVVWLVGIHSIVHGIFGLVFVATSGYVNFNPGIIHSFVVCHIILIILGIAVFCVIMWRRPACARIFAVLFAILAIAYLIICAMYLSYYFPFFANSIFDETFFYSDIECWVGPDYLLTFWHVITILLLLAILVWFFYACMLCKLAHCACFIPSPPPACAKVCEPPPPHPCCKVRWYQKIFKRGKCCPPPPCAPLPACPPTCPPVPPLPPCPQQSCQIFPSCPKQTCQLPPPCPQPTCQLSPPYPQQLYQLPPPDPQPSQPPASPPAPSSPPAPAPVAAAAAPAPPVPPSPSPPTKKCPKFVLTLKPGKLCK